jgi:hypothetical protein
VQVRWAASGGKTHERGGRQATPLDVSFAFQRKDQGTTTAVYASARGDVLASVAWNR